MEEYLKSLKLTFDRETILEMKDIMEGIECLIISQYKYTIWLSEIVQLIKNLRWPIAAIPYIILADASILRNPVIPAQYLRNSINNQFAGCDLDRGHVLSNRFEHPSFRESCKTSVETKKLKKHIFFSSSVFL